MYKYNNKTVTLTFGCIAENHYGMQNVGNQISTNGFTSENLQTVRHLFEEEGYLCKLYNLNEEIKDIMETGLFSIDNAEILVIKNGVELFTNIDDLFNYLITLDWDKKYWDTRKQDVLNKIARWNLIFSTFNQEPAYRNKKGRIYNINEIYGLKKIKTKIEDYFGQDFQNLECEGNYYYDINKCGISYHGDSERKKVIGMRFGESCDLHYWWYYKAKRINNRISIPLDSGDIYIMNQKATGNDWKKRNIFTLRHATGCNKYIK
jgi:hypothetical protein